MRTEISNFDQESPVMSGTNTPQPDPSNQMAPKPPNPKYPVVKNKPMRRIVVSAKRLSIEETHIVKAQLKGTELTAYQSRTAALNNAKELENLSETCQFTANKYKLESECQSSPPSLPPKLAQ